MTDDRSGRAPDQPLAHRLAPRPQVEARPFDGGALLVDLGSGACFELNSVGAEVWFLLDGQLSLAEVCRRLRPHYDVADEVLERDVSVLAQELLERGLLVAAG